MQTLEPVLAKSLHKFTPYNKASARFRAACTLPACSAWFKACSSTWRVSLRILKRSKRYRLAQSGSQGGDHARCVFGAKRIQINGQCRLLLRPRRCFFRRFLQRFHRQIVQTQQCNMVQAACNTEQCGGGKRLAVFQGLKQQLGGFVFQCAASVQTDSTRLRRARRWRWKTAW